MARPRVNEDVALRIGADAGRLATWKSFGIFSRSALVSNAMSGAVNCARSGAKGEKRTRATSERMR